MESQGYAVYESAEFKRISREWDEAAAERFVDALPDNPVVLKYPKASRVLRRWLRLIPDARVIYVFRPRSESVESQMKNWWGRRPFRLIGRLIYHWEWLRGYLAVSNVSVPVWFVTFAALKADRNIEFPADFGFPAALQTTTKNA